LKRAWASAAIRLAWPLTATYRRRLIQARRIAVNVEFGESGPAGEAEGDGEVD